MTVVLWHLARFVLSALLIVLAFCILLIDLSTDEAFAIAGLGAAALLLLALTPRLLEAISQRIAKVSLGPFAFEAFQAAERAVPAQPTEDPESRERDATSVLRLRLKIERKLTYLAKHVLDRDGYPTFLTVGSLKYDRLLPDDEADVVNRLMTMRDEDILTLPPRKQDEFLELADKVAKSIRASVLNAMVKKALEDELVPAGWRVEEIDRGPDRRPDLAAEIGDFRCRIVPVFATDERSDLLDAAIERLGEGEPDAEGYARRIIVLPHCSQSPRDLAGDPAVTTTDDFVDLMAESFSLQTSASPG